MDFKSRKPKQNKPSNLGQGSWLDDEWSDLASKSFLGSKNQAFDEGRDDEKVELNIKFSLPKLKVQKIKQIKSKTGTLSKSSLDKLSSKSKKTKLSLTLILVLAISGVIFTINYNNHKNPKGVAGASITGQPNEQIDIPQEAPKYKILYPGTKNSSTVGKIVRISPPSQSPAYTYVDNLGGVQINVTQQELPDNFKTDQEGQLDKLAKANNQNDIIQVDSIKVYSGQSTKGAQSITFIKGNLLIFIKSGNKISDEAWVAYISALHS